MNEIGQSWYVECRKHAVETGTLESFQQAVERVTSLAERTGNSIEDVEYFRPMCQNEPVILEFSTGKYYGAVALHSKTWSVNT